VKGIQWWLVAENFGGAKTILHSKVPLINYYKYECMQHIKISCLLILGLGHLHETFRFISVFRSRTVGSTPWTGDHLVARRLLTASSECDDDGEVGGMNGFGNGNRNTRRKPAPTPLCPPQIPLNQTRARTRAAAVGSHRLTASAMARPRNLV
jgi:hypothetical protein